MQEKIISMDKVGYLSDFFSELPSNCILNKGLTGCGGSYLELHSNRNSVILVPTIELVKNKTEEHIQPIYGKVKDSEVIKYLNSPVPYKKILGTYDSLPRILRLINPKDYFLLIDEYHILFNSYVFRDEAIKEVLNHYTDFNSYCFMSATPLEGLCILKELEHIDRLTLQWKDTVPVKIDVIDTYFTTNELFKLFREQPSGNWHIFLNSVNTIRQIVPKLDDDYKVVCSNVSKKKSQVKLNYGSTLDKPKKYNFYTSCSFEGCDLYDKNGRTVIICDTNIATTILDISTLLRQICGRLRDSDYKDQVTLILNTSKHRYAGISKEEFQQFVLNNINDGKRCEEQFKEFSIRDKNLELRKYSPETYNSFYANMYNNTIFYDDNLRKMDEYNYKLVREIYTNSISVIKECNNHNMEAKAIPLKGETWIRESLIKPEYTYEELEETFRPVFEQYGLEWNHNNSIDNYFPDYQKKRKTIQGKKYTVYKFY